MAPHHHQREAVFTGIIEAVGAVERVTPLEGGRRLRITAPFAVELGVDESVAVNGACLTVVARDEAAFEAVVVEETLAKTSLGSLEAGAEVNLERAVALGGRLDGHLVQGHVDATGTVEAVEKLADSWLVRVAYPEAFGAYLIPVGSVTLDGVSLTVARLTDDALTVAIIPHTWTHTTLAGWAPGRRVNLEFDVIGKYVVRALERGVGADLRTRGGFTPPPGA
jgi:riboflavin synthase